MSNLKSPLPYKVAYSQIPETKAWVSLRGRYSAHHNLYGSGHLEVILYVTSWVQCGPSNGDIRVTWKLFRNADTLNPSQTFRIRIYIFTNFQGIGCACAVSLRNPLQRFPERQRKELRLWCRKWFYLETYNKEGVLRSPINSTPLPCQSSEQIEM